MSKRATWGSVRVDRRSAVAVHLQVYNRIRLAIIEGRLSPGERLPSTRSLGVQLGVARGTVDAAYARLAGEGYIVGRGQCGTVVNPTLQPDVLRAPAGTKLHPSASNPKVALLPFRLGLPALDLFPRKLWARLVAREARTATPSSLAYPDLLGLSALRGAIASYLAVSRGILCDSEQIAITNGYQGGLNLAADILLEPGDTVWFEDPGYVFAREALQSLHMRIAPVPVDDEGMCVEHGQRYFQHARLAVVTPAHQAPLGVTLSLQRRQSLLTWATDNDAWILEDDYDCEFHYSGHKPPALKSIDGRDRVLYAGSFSKTLFPGLRLGYLVLPTTLISAAQQSHKTQHRGGSTFEQKIVATFMAEGHFARHLRRMRINYKSRRQALADALVAEFGDHVEIRLQPGGLYLLARFPSYGDDTILADRALRQALHPSPLSAQSIKHSAGHALLLGFTNIPERAAPVIAASLRKSLQT